MSKEKNPRLGKAGGQALIEGIMMNGPEGAALAVRHLPTGKIIVKPRQNKHLRDKSAFFGLPFIRGIVNFIESMVLGYGCLMESATLSGSMELTPEEQAEQESKLDKWLEKHFGPKMVAVISTISMILGLVISFGLFVFLPAFIIKTLDVHFFGEFLKNHYLRPLCEGVIRIAIFLGYLASVSQMKEMRRVFQYHGAEHKTIFCYESGAELTVENVRKQVRFHPRCGTNFMFLVIIISILCSSLLAFILGQFDGGVTIMNNALLWSVIKIVIIPFVVGIGYEYIRYAGRHENVCTKVVSAPGLWLQRITTKEPDDSMIEVGIASLKAAVYNEYPPEMSEEAVTGKKQDEEAADDDGSADAQS